MLLFKNSLTKANQILGSLFFFFRGGRGEGEERMNLMKKGETLDKNGIGCQMVGDFGHFIIWWL